ncbi:GH92 family glycosyl hydrolase [Mucilaginibacter sp. L3T2-6]|uniref:GH92 family glycosyl hydrolase n=1 Tax=Mucilaginibacter sp. L3T2-6 TaxID=3062491 RepID=UPI002676105F|nr:GH92 family glycosyl hydrolase [Mucilaginibacter sp. L3T2-6]MDO3644441.1 GH92 family glycosyl hydrolase [Mucilaginibacter sp. L3T2-6]MDV6216893.1 GH92 family glycosyl hydrolase [Mucilaginibacter sp. L3T2-6]
MKILKSIAFTSAALLTLGNVKAQSLLKYVDPDIGTAHSRWFFYTPAAVPGGMAKLGPSTNAHYGNNQGWEAVGYDTRQNSIEGFAHFHEWQVGGVSFMPTTGPIKVRPGALDTPGTGYRSYFNRKNQVAEPGYYKVLLDDYGITAELTATKRVGFDRYTFPASNQAHIILDIGNVQGESGPVLDAGIKMLDDTHFEGFVITYPKYVKIYDEGGRVNMYFYGELNKKPAGVGSFTASGIKQNSSAANGKGAGLFLNYQTAKGEAIEIKVGLSYTSAKNAKANLLAEAAHLTFAQAKINAQKTWERDFDRLRVEGKDDTAKVKFYTGLYHSLLGRGIASDVNGAYPMHRGKVGQLHLDIHGKLSYNFMNTDAIWGGFWDLTQLWALSYPGWYEDFVHTQLQIYKDKGWFGDGIANSEYVSGVGTNFVGLAIAGAYQCGIRNYDVNLAYQAIKNNELGYKNRKVGSGKMDTKAFLEHGYSPFIDEDRTDSTGAHFSASHTLEYSFSAFAAAQMAKDLGKTDDYKKFIKYSNGWRMLYNPANKLLQPKRADGTFIDKFDPYAPWRGYQEGNAVQYSYYVPQNPAALVSLYGKEKFSAKLDSIFTASEKDGFGGGKVINAFAGINAIYNHGNEPSLHICWLFNFAGKPWLTQKWTRAISDGFYGIEPIHGYGYGQDEDQGQLGSWYVITALGLFDVKGFTDSRPIIELGSPLFDKATITLGNHKTLVIETKNNSKTNVYVQSVEFNGKLLDNCWLYRDELMKGGKMIFTMGSKPNKAWGSKVPPPSVQ